MANSFKSRRAFEPIPNHLIGQLTAIYEFKGKEKLYQVQAPELLAALQSSAIIESTESSNRIEGVVASPERVRQIVGKGAAPSNRSEAEIAGYRDVLGQIHASNQFIPITPNVILQLHRDMFKYTPARAGMWKPVENTIEATTPDGGKEVVFQPVSPFSTPTAMEELCTDFAQTTATGNPDPLLATAAFVLDFLCIHPFLDGNGRLARLLTTLLFYKAGFTVARYVGVERLVEKTKPSYYESLRASSEHWHEGQHSLIPWWEYFLGITLAAYVQLDQKLGGGDLPSKADRVRLAVQVMPSVFSKAELAGVCPKISDRTVKRVLDELRAEGTIEVAKRGRNAMWRKI
ncbi:MAG: Fic family protein [Acidobacteriota bacterium]